MSWPKFECIVLTMHMCELRQFKSFYLDRLSWAHSQSKCRISGHNHLCLFGVVECTVDYKIYPWSLGLFTLDSIITSRRAYTLAAHWQTEHTMPSLPSLYHFLYFSMKRQSTWTWQRSPLWQILLGFEPMIFWSLILCFNQFRHSGQGF